MMRKAGLRRLKKKADELYNNNPKSSIKVEILNREQSAARHGGGYIFIKPRKPGDKKD
jgi:hypothetical protein